MICKLYKDSHYDLFLCIFVNFLQLQQYCKELLFESTGTSFFNRKFVTYRLLTCIYPVKSFFYLPAKEAARARERRPIILAGMAGASLRSWRNIVARGRPTRGKAARSERRSRGISKRLLLILLSTSPPVFTLHCQTFTSHANNPASYAG